MFSSYFKTAWRNMMSNKTSSFINIAGLSISIACALLILIFIRFERGYDRFHQDADRTFQVILNGNMNGQEFWGGNTPPPVGAALANNIPEIESFTRFYKPQDMVVRYEANSTAERFFTEKNVLAVDSNFLQLFDFKLLEGNAATALLRPGSVVITEDVSKKYFGTESAMGKTLVMDNDKKPFTVTAVLKNIPAQSSIQFDFLTPMADYPIVKRMSWSWVWRLMTCYVKLKDHVKVSEESLREVEAKFPPVIRVQAASGFKRIGKPFDKFIQSGGKWDFHLLPLTRIHLYSADINMPWLSHLSSIKYVYIFASIAVFILILACVNFMNLSTARAAKRAKEVGIRKVIGSAKAQLIRQFLAEAFLYSFVSMLLGYALVLFLVKPFSDVAGESITIYSALAPWLWLFAVFLAFAVGLLAGSYPAFYLTSFNAVSVLKGNGLFKTGKGAVLRNVLVVFQFAVSTIIIIGTITVYRQLQFFHNADMGFSKDNVVIISATNRLGSSEETFRQTISQLQGIKSASITTSVPSGFLFGDSYIPEADGKEQPQTKELNLNSFMVDEQFIPTLKIQLTRGRNFSRDFTDSAAVILNEEAVKEIGWKDPIGKWLTYPGGDGTRFQVVGVVRDFNVVSLHSIMQPFALFYATSKTYDLGVSHVVARIRPGNINQTLQELETKWKTFASGEPFDYNFLDAAFDATYHSEQRLAKLFTVFAALSLFIACLGLFGLSTYIAERRTKEIGVRKVLGASEKKIVVLLSRDFLKLTLIAVLIAFPVAWWAMDKWLQDFAYRIHLDWSVFVIAAVCTMLIAVFTISFQSIKAAVANPAISLRSE